MLWPQVSKVTSSVHLQLWRNKGIGSDTTVAGGAGREPADANWLPLFRTFGLLGQTSIDLSMGNLVVLLLRVLSSSREIEGQKLARGRIFSKPSHPN